MIYPCVRLQHEVSWFLGVVDLPGTTVQQRILVVDDEERICEVVKAYLEKEGYQVETALRGRDALARMESDPSDLVVLDLMLPDLSGYEVLRALRLSSTVPVILLTARTGEDNIVAGLTAGADDYLEKPFGARVLVARVQSLLRRSSTTAARGSAGEAAQNQILRPLPGIELDEEAVAVRWMNRTIPFTRNEFRLFSALAHHPQRTFTREDLIAAAFGDAYEGYGRTVDSHIKNARRKLVAVGADPDLIRTVHGIGYRLGGGTT